MAVRGVRIEGDVGEEDDAGALRLHFSDRPQGEVVRIQRFRAFRRLAVGVDLREQGDAMDPEELELRALGRELGEGDSVDTGERSDGLCLLAFGHEEGLNQVTGLHDGLREHRTDASRRSEAAEADGLVQGVRHGKRGIALWSWKGNGEGIMGPT